VIAVKPGQRVQLVEATPELLADGLRPGMIGRVRRTPGGALGVEFDNHSDTGHNAGLHVTCINTRRSGQTVTVISLCRPLN
jgi:hypothetical protein